MAADSNMNFFTGGVFPPSFYNQHVVSFQPEAGFGFGGGASSAVVLGGYGSLLVEPLPGLKHDTGLAVDWSFNEQAVLSDGLNKYAGEPGMMKYIKIAAMLRDKSVRDVALRCRWMARENVKRRKLEENYARKTQTRKEKIPDSSPKGNTYSVRPENMAAYSYMLQPTTLNTQFSYEVPAVDSSTQHLLEENIQVLEQIANNLSTCQQLPPCCYMAAS